MNTPDLTSYRLVHRAIRQSTARLSAALGELAEADRSRRGRALARWYGGFEGELHLHHTLEDHVYFPALFRHVPTLRGYLERIDDEHRRLGELIDDTGAAIRRIADPNAPFAEVIAPAVARAAELEALMDGHLDFEDAEILPLFTRHMDAAEYDAVEAQALADPNFAQLRFTVPWMMANANDEERRHLLDGAPLMMKVLWIATRRRHDRLTTAALGTVEAASAPAVTS
jgi:Hemerythrin HHE cation binding domain